jgi:hypothetical protein
LGDDDADGDTDDGDEQAVSGKSMHEASVEMKRVCRSFMLTPPLRC